MFFYKKTDTTFENTNHCYFKYIEMTIFILRVTSKISNMMYCKNFLIHKDPLYDITIFDRPFAVSMIFCRTESNNKYLYQITDITKNKVENTVIL